MTCSGHGLPAVVANIATILSFYYFVFPFLSASFAYVYLSSTWAYAPTYLRRYDTCIVIRVHHVCLWIILKLVMYTVWFIKVIYWFIDSEIYDDNDDDMRIAMSVICLCMHILTIIVWLFDMVHLRRHAWPLPSFTYDITLHWWICFVIDCAMYAIDNSGNRQRVIQLCAVVLLGMLIFVSGWIDMASSFRAVSITSACQPCYTIYRVCFCLCCG